VVWAVEGSLCFPLLVYSVVADGDTCFWAAAVLARNFEGERGRGDRRTRIASAGPQALGPGGLRLDNHEAGRPGGRGGPGPHPLLLSGKDEILLEVLMDASEEYARET
jgi:hypothetical protein